MCYIEGSSQKGLKKYIISGYLAIDFELCIYLCLVFRAKCTLKLFRVIVFLATLEALLFCALLKFYFNENIAKL